MILRGSLLAILLITSFCCKVSAQSTKPPSISAMWLVDGITGEHLLRIKNRARVDIAPFAGRVLNVLAVGSRNTSTVLFRTPSGPVRRVTRPPFVLMSGISELGISSWGKGSRLSIRVGACGKGCRVGRFASITNKMRVTLIRPSKSAVPHPSVPPLSVLPGDDGGTEPGTNVPTPTSTPTIVPTPIATGVSLTTPTPHVSGTPNPMVSATPAVTSSPTPLPTQEVPKLQSWKDKMVTNGSRHCTTLVNSDTNGSNVLSLTYYDATRVFQQIGEYTNDSSWARCAQAAEHQYRDLYVIPNSGKIPGYWIFTGGLTRDYLTTGDSASSNAVSLLGVNGAYAPDATPVEWLQGWEYSRETALNIISYLDAERLGGQRRARLAPLVNTALGHIDQWFVTKKARYVKSFMVGLTCLALIDYHSVTGDSRIVPAVRIALDGLWDLNWSEASKAFKYTDIQNPGDDPPVPSPDLNQLISPAYEWLYRQTNEERFRTRGDKIFAGGVDFGYSAGAKQFNQLYRWSFDYVRWRALP